MEITFEPLSADNYEKVWEIESQSFTIPWSKEAIRNELSNKTAHYIVAKIGGIVVGYAGMWCIHDEGHITNIAVSHEYRSRGIGGEILKKLIKKAESMGVGYMTLEVRVHNLTAQRLYSRHGFKNVGTRHKYYHDNGEDAVIMIREAAFWKKV